MDSSNLQETLDKIDSAILAYEKDLEAGVKLKRLLANPDFQDLILDGYFNTESKKLFDILTDPSGASCYSSEQIHLMLSGISHFKGYIGTDAFEGTIQQDARRAPDAIATERAYRLEVTREYNSIGESK